MTQPWAAPDTAAQQPRRTPPDEVHTVAPDDEAEARVGPTAVDLEPTPLPLRPMTIPDLLDGAVAILKRRPRDVLVLAAAFVIPVQLVSAILLRDVLGASGIAGTGLGDPTSSVGIQESGELTGVASTIVALLIDVCSLTLLAGALALLVADWYEGAREPPSRTVLRTLRRAPALLTGVVVVHLLEALGVVALGVGAYVAMGLLHVVSPVVAAEGLGPFAAVRRSVQLTSSQFWRSMAVPALVAMVGMLLGFGFQLIPELATVLVGDEWNWLIRATGGMLSQLVVAPFTAGVAVLYHLDLRIRSEGYDIERQVAALRGRT